VTEISNLKTPAWQRIVAELTSPTADERVFLLRLTSILGQVSAARTAVFFTLPPQGSEGPTGPEPRAALVWPLAPDLIDAQGRMTLPMEQLFSPARTNEAAIDKINDLKRAARMVAVTRQVGIFSVDGGDDLMYESSGRGQVLAVPVLSGPQMDANAPLQGVVTMLLEGRSKQAVQTTLAIVELIAGYVFNQNAQQQLRRIKASSASLDLAARLLSSINQAPNFKGCCYQFVNDLCRHLTVDRVAMGWVHGSGSNIAVKRGAGSGKRTVKAIALSDTENIDRRMAMFQKLEHAMEECLDQEQTVAYPIPPANPNAPTALDPVLAQAVTHSHRELAASDAKLRVASFPLRVGDSQGDRIVGIITVESSGEGAIDLAGVELIQSTLDLVAPVLAVRHSDDRLILSRMWDATLKAGAWAVGPKHTVWKLAGVALMLTTLFIFLYHTPYRIGAPAELQPRERRTISVPFDGRIAAIGAGVEPGKRVAAGELLVEFDTSDMRLSQLEAQSQILQYEKEADELLKTGKIGEAQQSKAKRDQAEAKANLLGNQIERSRVVAPIAGTVTSGDLKDKIGASIKLGDKLFDLADLSDMVVIAKVDDRDITMIELGQTGEVSPKSDPSLTVAFTVERIVPLAMAQEGINAFEVHCKLNSTPAWFRPGMEGQVKFNGPTKSVAWIISRRILDTMRVWLWW
jgi:hypothetical protein